jgi:hypothetical protein
MQEVRMAVPVDSSSGCRSIRLARDLVVVMRQESSQCLDMVPDPYAFAAVR